MFTRIITCTVIAAALCGGIGVVGVRAQSSLLPDLISSAATLRDYQITREGSQVLLRLSNTVANVGDGPVEVIGHRRGGVMPATQLLYPRSGGRPRTVPIGQFTYHDVHHHWHLLQVAEYRLRNASGAVVRSSEKVSFCLADEHLDYPQLPGAPRRAVFGPCPRSRSAKQIRSGISVGWGDTYPKFVAGQWIDITGVPAGQYTLESEANPDAIIQEKTRANNLASISIRIP